MRTIIFKVTIMAALGLFALACNQSNKKAAPLPEGNIEVGPMDVTFFVFKEYNTRMAIPEAWLNNVELAKGPATDCDGCAAEYIATFTSNDGKESNYLGGIYVFSKSQWKAVPDEWKGIYTKVGEVNGFTYYYKSNQSNPYDETTPIGQEYQSHVILMPDARRLITIENRE